MSSSKRVVFTFDERSYQSLEKTKTLGSFRSLADTVRESIRIASALQSQADQGFTEVLVRNPKTGDQRSIMLPPLFVERDLEDVQS